MLWRAVHHDQYTIECCLEDDCVSFDVFYGISDNKDSWFDIEHARKRLGYDPSDSADEYIHDMQNDV